MRFSLIRSMLSDISVNYKHGLFTVYILLMYRIGNTLHNRRKSCWRLFYPIYTLIIFPLRKIYGFFCHFAGCFIPFSAQLGNHIEFRHAFYGIFISGHAKLGNNITLLHNVTIGSNFDTSQNPGAPELGNNIFIGAGATIIGKIIIGDNSKIGANATVVTNVPEGATFVSPKAESIK